MLFYILKRPYGYEEKCYLTQRVLEITETRWVKYAKFFNKKKMMSDEQKDSFVAQELWIPAKLVAYIKQNQEKNREMYGDSAKYKRYQRYMKKYA